MNFDEKYNKILSKIDSLINEDYNPKNIKKYLESYKIENKIEERNQKKKNELILINKENNSPINHEEKRKKTVGLKEIREHCLKIDKMKIERIANNEIKKMKMKDQENEYISKMEKDFNINIKKFSISKNLEQEENEKKKLLVDKSLKIREFSKLVHKLNFEKIKNQKNEKNKFEIEYRNHSSDGRIRKNNLIPIKKNNNEKKININNKNDKNIKKNSKEKIKLPFIPKKPRNKTENENKRINKQIEKEKDNRYNIDKRKPLDVKPDYLHQNNLQIFPVSKQKIYEKKQKISSQEQYIDNINKLKMQAEKYEDEAKKEELLIKVNGGRKYNAQKCAKVSSLLYDSISTKLALLKQINSELHNK